MGEKEKERISNDEDLRLRDGLYRREGRRLQQDARVFQFFPYFR